MIVGVFHRGPRVPDEFSPEGRCTHCGHAIPARCVVCNREMLCGEAGEPCPSATCAERVLADAGHDLTCTLLEAPRQAVGPY